MDKITPSGSNRPAKMFLILLCRFTCFIHYPFLKLLKINLNSTSFFPLAHSSSTFIWRLLELPQIEVLWAGGKQPGQPHKQLPGDKQALLYGEDQQPNSGGWQRSLVSVCGQQFEQVPGGCSLFMTCLFVRENLFRSKNSFFAFVLICPEPAYNLRSIADFNRLIAIPVHQFRFSSQMTDEMLFKRTRFKFCICNKQQTLQFVSSSWPEFDLLLWNGKQ